MIGLGSSIRHQLTGVSIDEAWRDALHIGDALKVEHCGTPLSER